MKFVSDSQILYRGYYKCKPDTTKGTSGLLLRKMIFLHYITEDLTSFTKCEFLYSFFIIILHTVLIIISE